MRKITSVLKTESRNTALWVALFSILMQAVFLMIGKWDQTVLAGGLLGGTAAIGNFVGMGITVQIAVDREEPAAKDLLRISRGLRTSLLLLISVLGICLPVFNSVATVLPLFFPRLSFLFRPLFFKRTAQVREHE